jgi:hypothetical protein
MANLRRAIGPKPLFLHDTLDEEGASNGRKITEKSRSPAYTVTQYPVGR